MQITGVKALLAAVIVMGVMILLGTAVLVSVVVKRAMHGPAVAAVSVGSPQQRPQGQGLAPLALDLPPGTRILSVTRQSDTLVAVAVSGGGAADRLLVWDIAAGRVVARLTLGR